MGIAFPSHYWRGVPRFGAREGVLVDGGTNGTKGLWRFSLDGATASRLAGGSGELDEPVDVRLTDLSIFVLNRSADGQSAERVAEANRRARVLRLSGGQLLNCRTDQPVVDPCGLAWEPGSGDLYVLCGHHGRSGREGGCVVRLGSTGRPGEFVVTRVLDGFELPTDAGLDISNDGLHMVVTEQTANQMVILWEFRRATAKSPPADGLAGF
jgi:hypothetical protein